MYDICMHTIGPTEEEYVILANYTTEMEGELNVSAGEVVQLINRDTTGRYLIGLILCGLNI